MIFLSKLLGGNLFSERYEKNVFVLIADRWQVTFALNIIAVLLAWSIAVPLGIRSARKVGTLEDRVTTTGLFALWSLPNFFVATLLLVFLCTDSSYGVHLFPSRGELPEEAQWYNGVQLLGSIAWHWALPLIALTYASFTALSRYMRGNLLDQLHADYITTARAKGASEDRLVYGHAVPNNSMVTMITLGSTLLTELFGGFLIVELIFSIDGLGILMYEAALYNDIPLLMGSTVVTVLLLLVSILVADILYAVVDPRIRSRYA